MICTPQITPIQRTHAPRPLPVKPIPLARATTVQDVRDLPEDVKAFEVVVAAHGFPGRARYLFDSSSTAADNGTTILRPIWLTAAEPGRWLLEELTAGSFEPLGAVAAHEAAPDPHPGYQREIEKGVAGGYASLDGSAFVPDAQIPPGIARDTEITAAIVAHEGAVDPHSQYELDSNKNIASGYAGLNASARVALIRGGTDADLSGTGGASQVLRQSSPGAAITVSQLAAADLSNGTTGSGAVALASAPNLDSLVIDTFEDLEEVGGDPSSPAAGYLRVYPKAAGLFSKNSAGTVTGPFGQGMPAGAFGDALFHDGSNWVAVNITADRFAFIGDSAEATGLIARKVRQADLSYRANTGHSFVEHWLAGLFSGETGWTTDHSGAGATVTANTGIFFPDGNHPGIAVFDTGTTTTGQASLHKGTQTIRLGGGKKIIEMKIRIEDLSTVAQEFVLYLGLSNRKDSTSNFVGFVYQRTTSVNWIGRTVDNGAPTDSISSIAVVADAWITLRIEINAAGNSVEFFVDGTSIGAATTTNIPTAAGREVGPRLVIVKASAGTSNRLMYVDLYGLEDEFTTDS